MRKPALRLIAGRGGRTGELRGCLPVPPPERPDDVTAAANCQRAAASATSGRPRSTAVTGPADTAALIEQLHANGVVLTYDPDDRTLRAGGHDPLSVAIGQDH